MRLPAKAGLHDEIVRVSIQLGSELGEDGLTMRAIAARLGVSATALYQHFESKAAILREIRSLGVRTLLEAMAPAFQCEDPTVRIVEAAQRYVEFATGNPWLYKVLFHEEEVDWTQLSESEKGRLMAPLEETRKAFTYGVERGVFLPDLDVRNAALLLWASMHGLASLLISGRLSEAHPAYPIPDRDQFVRSFVEQLVRSVKA